MSTPVVDHRAPAGTGAHAGAAPLAARVLRQAAYETGTALRNGCLLYTSDAADE